MSKEDIEGKLIKLKELLNNLKYVAKKFSEEEFCNNEVYIGYCERLLFLAIQISIDMAMHIVSVNKLGVSNSYYDCFEILEKYNYINKYNLDTYRKMVGLRNKLLHDYEEIQPKMIYSVMKNNLDDFNKFLDEIKKYL